MLSFLIIISEKADTILLKANKTIKTIIRKSFKNNLIDILVFFLKLNQKYLPNL